MFGKRERMCEENGVKERMEWVCREGKGRESEVERKG